jgi:hypothetical protein
MIERLGIRSGKALRELEQATSSVEGVSATMQSLLRLLARSRKVELDVFITQFGPIIRSEQLQKIKRDLADLIEILGEEGE